MLTFHGFIEFLKSEDALGSYLNACSQYRTEYHSDPKKIAEHIISYYDEHAIDGAFSWMDTPNGVTFWSALHEKFKKQYFKDLQVGDSVNFSDDIKYTVKESPHGSGYYLEISTDHAFDSNNKIFTVLRIDDRIAFCKECVSDESHITGFGVFPYHTSLKALTETVKALDKRYSREFSTGWLLQLISKYVALPREKKTISGVLDIASESLSGSSSSLSCNGCRVSSFPPCPDFIARADIGAGDDKGFSITLRKDKPKPIKRIRL